MSIVFLRTVEYYRGILFLTTNRVGMFDDAFISRIHIVIHYENFTDEYRRQVWTQFFTKLESERRKEIGVSRSAKNYVLHDPEMQCIKWNGREIRNGKREFLKSNFVGEQAEPKIKLSKLL